MDMRGPKKIGLLLGGTCVAVIVMTIGVAVRMVLSNQLQVVELNAERVYDAAMPKIAEATKMIRGLERLTRDGESILLIADEKLRADRRIQLEAIVGDSTLKGDAATRELIVNAFATLDENLADLNKNGPAARDRSLERWKPISTALSRAADSIGTEASTVTSNETDHIIDATISAQKSLRISVFLVFGLTLISLAILYYFVIRPLVRLTGLLEHAREGKPIEQRSEFVREIQMLNDATTEMSVAYSELETARNQLDQLAHTDSLTGLANRRQFQSQGTQEFDRSKRYNYPVSAIVFDIDHFKNINDRYGHEGGDCVLRELGVYLRKAARSADLYARVGGEEFAILLPQADQTKASVLAQRLCGEIAQIEVAAPSGEVIKFTSSFGVAQNRETDGDLNNLLRRADQALYRAKEGGRNRVVVAGAGPG